ncbi:uncharacterized protein LOC129321047 [Prosopis cineraria]|uniref:uncharacterized protein LOC129321047 n=1 Tax=Prosopis cineraria TaxID=364024 RepID=UPI00240E9FED|nr:uncharacterized protein LOC129321047 [Prosopis cineraria]
MASLIHKISRNSSLSFRVLSTIKVPTLPAPTHTDSPIPLQTLLSTRLPVPTSSTAPVWSLSDGCQLNSPQSFQFFPSFPFGFCFDHVVSTESEKLGVDDTDTPRIEHNDARTLWADSVKRKRKRKMNKHKYKKLRKRLRRKT